MGLAYETQVILLDLEDMKLNNVSVVHSLLYTYTEIYVKWIFAQIIEVCVNMWAN